MSRALPWIVFASLVFGLDAAASEPPPVPPVDAAQALAQACNQRRFTDAGEWLHSTLRRKWAEIDYSTAQFCAVVSRDFTLQSLDVRRDYMKDDYAVVELTLVYADGSRRDDRATFLLEAGRWKLAN